MKKTKRLPSTLVGAVVLAAASPATSSPHSGVDSQLYRQSLDPHGVYSLEGAETMPKHDFSMKVGVGYHQNPLRVSVPGIGGDEGVDSILEFTLAMHFTMSFALTERLQLGLDAGLYRTNTDAGYGDRGRYRDTGSEPSTGLIALRPLTNIDPSGGFQDHGLAGPFDARVGLKYALVRKPKGMSISLLATASVPFGDEEMFLGDSNFVFDPRIAIDYKFDPLSKTKLVANIGAHVRERTVLESFDANPGTPNDVQAVLDIGSELVVGGGAVFEALPQLLLGAEAVAFVPLPAQLSYGTCRLDDGRRCSELEDMDYFSDAGYGDLAAYAVGGIDYRATPDTTLFIAGGAGLIGARRDDFRILSGVQWTPTPEGARTIGRGDRDGDNIPDSTDICPDEPEDVDGYQDEDGCPELDNDGDGIIDENDACPDDPEDKDGYQDDDGCAETDNDGDNLPDVTDRCPNDPEDFDNFEDDDGCPDEDNDGDGIPDDKDKCPNRAETVNGVDDTDGCPDERPTTGPVEGNDRIDLRGNEIRFTNARSDQLTNASKQILDQVADIIKKNPNMVVRVEVYVPLSTESKNRNVIRRAQARDKRLSQERADNVVQYLVRGANVPARQVQNGVGLGSERPLQNTPPEDPLNERVDFIKVRQQNP